LRNAQRILLGYEWQRALQTTTKGEKHYEHSIQSLALDLDEQQTM
jgi:hypothetical protein